jgi:hypothetical protein
MAERDVGAPRTSIGVLALFNGVKPGVVAIVVQSLSPECDAQRWHGDTDPRMSPLPIRRDAA